MTFTTLPEKPLVILEQSGSVTPFAATLRGEVNPENQSTTCTFEYGIVVTEHKTPCEQSPLAGGPQTATLAVSGLTSATTYHYRVVVKNATGEVKGTGKAAEEEFTTLTAVKPVVESEPISGLTSEAVRLEAVINPEYQEVTSCEFQYGTEASLATPTTVGCEPATLAAAYGGQGVGVNVSGLVSKTKYYYRVVAKNATGTEDGTIEHFTAQGSPIASTGAVSEIGQSSANVTGTVTPEGAETYYYYQYGPSTEYGQSTAPEGPGISVGAGLSAVPAPATLVPLTPGVAYHYRLVAWNEDGTSYGQDEMFTAVAGQSPLASTGPASGVSVSEATISGTIDPQGKETSYRFEYGTNTEYGTQAFGTVLPEQGEQTVTLSLRGLDPGTTYHYRLIVSNPAGTSEGADETFTTPGILDPLVNPAVAPLIANPAIAFPKEEKGSGTTTKTLTKAEKLKKALKACHAKKGKKRASCEAAAREKDGSSKEKKRKK